MSLSLGIICMNTLLFRLFLAFWIVSLTACGGGSSESSNPNKIEQSIDVKPPVISLNGDSLITINHNDSYIELGAQAIDDVDGEITVIINGLVDSSIIANYDIVYTATDSSNNTSSVTRKVTVKDNTPPDIKLIGNSLMSINHNDTYVELGAKAVDDIDGELTVKISGIVDSSIIGFYDILYTATDSSNNTNTVTRTVIVKDITPPVLTLNGSSLITINHNDSYVELGAKAIDDIDGEVEVIAIGVVDNSTVGSYKIVYTASDSSNNTNNVTRTIRVIDNTPPVITLNGNSLITVNQNEKYDELGATATDETDGVVTVMVAGVVNTSKIGNYEIAYTATDSANNTQTATRTISVIDVTPPILTLNGNSTLTINHSDSYIELGANASDDNDGKLTVKISGTVDTFKLGSYEILYSATDSANNSHSIIRTINVIDITPPTITLNGDRELSLTQWDNYVELGVIAIDNVDENVKITINGEVDNTKVGDFIITYTAMDKSNNEATVTRIVSIIPQRGFITTWTTDPNNTNDKMIIIRTLEEEYDYNYIVDWGDGSLSKNLVGDSAHAYSDPGTYTITINGVFPYLRMNNVDPEKLLTIEQWGDIRWHSLSKSFAGSKNLQGYALDAPDLSRVEDLSWMFLGAEKFNQNIANWDVSSVKNMDRMFMRASNFNQNLNSWNVSSVTNMDSMFYAAWHFNQDLSHWDVSSVKNMDAMFGATQFNQNITTWDVSSVKYMKSMFADNNDFDQDISKWDVSSVIDMRWMFKFSENFNQDIGKWNVSSVTKMNSMFSNAYKFNQDLSNWNVSKVENMEWMFSKARQFNQDISNWDVGSVMDMGYMFNGAKGFNQNLGNWNITSVDNMDWMFYEVTFSKENYDQLLIGWSKQNLKDNIFLHGGYSVYSLKSLDSRERLIDLYNWRILDGGLEL